MNFEDVNSFSVSGYLVPNECVKTWNELLDGVSVNRAAGICSGGEIGFFSLLPHVRRELVLVDHSYYSLAAAMYKYLVLRKLGWKEAHQLFTGDDPERAQAVSSQVKTELPDVLQQAFTAVEQDAGVGLSRHKSVKGFWKRVPEEILKDAFKRLDKITFIHGDLSDLEHRGPFGLLYLSNALEHSGRIVSKIQLKAAITRAVRPGGLIVLTGRHGSSRDRTDGAWERVKTVSHRAPGYREPAYDPEYYTISWSHQMYRVPKKPQTQAVAA